VAFVSGVGDGGDGWAAVVEGVGGLGTVTYDRAGIGLSDRRTLPELDQRWQRQQRATAAAVGAEQVIATTGGHYGHRDEPRLVVAAVATVAALQQ
jgi:hypothetical protein